MTKRNFMENTGYSWDGYKKARYETDKEFGAGAYDALTKHANASGKPLQSFNDVSLEDIVSGKTNDEYKDTYKFHKNVVNSDFGRAFLNDFAGRSPDSMKGFYTDKTVSSTSSISSSRGSVLNTPTFGTTSSKRRPSLFGSINQSLFGN